MRALALSLALLATTAPLAAQLDLDRETLCGPTGVDSDRDHPQVYYADRDADGYGDPESGGESCTQPSGYVVDDKDCDDSDETAWPGAPGWTPTCRQKVSADVEGGCNTAALAPAAHLAWLLMGLVALRRRD